MNAAAASLAAGSMAMSQNVPNMKRNPLPLSQFSWNTRCRSSAETLIAGVVALLEAERDDGVAHLVPDCVVAAA